MIDDIDDNYRPGVQADPLFGYEELRDVLDPATGRLFGKFGELGMTIEEATRNAEQWWKVNRQAMPDYGKPQDYLEGYGMKSGVLLGLPWERLNKGEKIAVVKQWHTHVGIPKYVLGFNANQEKDYQNVITQAKREARVRSFDLAPLFGPANPEARH